MVCGMLKFGLFGSVSVRKLLTPDWMFRIPIATVAPNEIFSVTFTAPVTFQTERSVLIEPVPPRAKPPNCELGSGAKSFRVVLVDLLSSTREIPAANLFHGWT